MSLKDWISSPAEWGDWGTRANAWFNELKNEVVRLSTTVFWQSADGVRSWYIKDDTANGRVEEHTDGANWKEVHYNGVRSELHNQNSSNWYRNDEVTPILTLNKSGEGEVSIDGNVVIEPAGTAQTLTIAESAVSSNRLAFQFTGIWQEEAQGVRVTYNDLFNRLQYMDDGGTEIGRWERAQGYLILKRWPKAAFNYYSNWADYGGTWGTCELNKSPAEKVHLEGLVRRTNTAMTGSTPILLLPSWARPPTQRMFACMTSGGVGRVDVATNGQVILVSPNLGVNGWVSLSDVHFNTT